MISTYIIRDPNSVFPIFLTVLTFFSRHLLCQNSKYFIAKYFFIKHSFIRITVYHLLSLGMTISLTNLPFTLIEPVHIGQEARTFLRKKPLVLGQCGQAQCLILLVCSSVCLSHKSQWRSRKTIVALILLICLNWYKSYLNFRIQRIFKSF